MVRQDCLRGSMTALDRTGDPEQAEPSAADCSIATQPTRGRTAVAWSRAGRAATHGRRSPFSCCGASTGECSGSMSRTGEACWCDSAAGPWSQRYIANACLAPDDTRLRYCVAEFLHEASAARPRRRPYVTGRLCAAIPTKCRGARQLLGIVHADLGQLRRGDWTVPPSGDAGTPHQAAFWANLGVMLKIEGQFDAAFKAYDRAIALAPQDARIRVNRTVALLHAGRFDEAWPEFEWRLALPEHRGMGGLRDACCHLCRDWPDVTGRTVLVTHEDGFGDTMQFMRYCRCWRNAALALSPGSPNRWSVCCVPLTAWPRS